MRANIVAAPGTPDIGDNARREAVARTTTAYRPVATHV
jgi:hypothetical protein